MVNNSDILAIFAATPPPETPAKLEAPQNGDDGFRDHLDLAIRETTAPQENSRPQSDSQDQNPTTRDQNQNTSSKENPSSDQKQTTSPSEEEGFNHHVPSAENTPDTPNHQVTSTDSQERQTLDPLGGLNIHQEKINALLKLLDGEEASNNASLIQAIRDLVQINDNAAMASLQNRPSQNELITLTHSRQSEIADLLAQAGLTRQEVQNFLDKLLASRLAQPTFQEILTHKGANPNPANLAPQNDVSVEISKQASGQPGSKNQGEGGSQPKADFLFQFNLKGNSKSEPSDNNASIQKILNQQSHQTKTVTPKEGGAKIDALAQAQREIFSDREVQGLVQNSSRIADGLSAKGLENIKPGGDFQIQNVNAVSENHSKVAETAKPSFPETLASRGTSEAKVIQQIIDKFSIRSSGNQNQIKIKLDPPSLGTVRINISTSGESVRTVIVAENHMVKQIIENNFTQLKDSMAGQGMKLDSFSVLVGGESGKGGHNDPQDDGLGFSHNFRHEDTERFAPEEDSFLSRSSIFTGEPQSLSVFA